MGLRDLFQRLFGVTPSASTPAPTGRNAPESLHLVEMTEESVTWVAPDQTTRSIRWDELSTVEIMTTDAGPFFSDVFWILKSSGATLMVPQGATGEKALLTRLQLLPEFNNLALISAMGSTDNAVFLLWSSKQSESNDPK